MKKSSSSDDYISTGFFVLIVLIGIVLYQKWINARENKEFATANTSLQTALSNVCKGTGVPEASAYDSKASFHSMIILSATGEFHDWSKNIPIEWLPQDIASAELVACLGNEEEVQIGSECLYTGGPSMTRVQFKLPIEVRLAQTGEVILAETFIGSSPDPCPKTANVSDLKVSGSHISYGEVENWLTQFVVDDSKLPVVVKEIDAAIEGKAASGQAIISTGTVNDMAISPDGKLLITSINGANKQDLSVWDATSGEHLAGLLENTTLYAPSYAVAFNSDGKTFASGEKAIILWDTLTFAQKKVFEIDNNATVVSLAFSQNKNLLAAGLSTGKFIVWDSNSYEQLFTFDGGYTEGTAAEGTSNVVFSPNSEMLAFATDNIVNLWDTTTWEKIATYSEGYKLLVDQVKSLAFSPNGETLVIGTWGNKIFLRDIEKGTLLSTLIVDEDSGYNLAAFHPDGTTLISTSNSKLILWDVATGKRLATVNGNSSGIIMSMTSLADMSIFMTGSTDGPIIVWKFAE